MVEAAVLAIPSIGAGVLSWGKQMYRQYKDVGVQVDEFVKDAEREQVFYVVFTGIRFWL